MVTKYTNEVHLHKMIDEYLAYLKVFIVRMLQVKKYSTNDPSSCIYDKGLYSFQTFYDELRRWQLLLRIYNVCL